MNTLFFDESEDSIKKAAKIIADGGLVAFPTETVYGLGADAFNPEAVKAIYVAKNRPLDNPTIIHISKESDLEKLTDCVTDDMRKLANAFWPGPMTMVVKAKPEIPRQTTGGLDTVGVRMPSNEIARKLISESGCLIAAPSANLSGKPSPTKAIHVKEDLAGRIDAIIESGDCEVGIESTVIDMTGNTPVVLRPGIITPEKIAEALGKTPELDPTLNALPEDAEGLKPKAPGMKYKHYAPNAKMTIFEGEKDAVRQAISEEKEQTENAGNKVLVMDFLDEDGELAARKFFAMLRAADEEGYDTILAAALPEEGVGFSVMNRMLRSAGFNIKNV